MASNKFNEKWHHIAIKYLKEQKPKIGGLIERLIVQFQQSFVCGCWFWYVCLLFAIDTANVIRIHLNRFTTHAFINCQFIMFIQFAVYAHAARHTSHSLDIAFLRCSPVFLNHNNNNKLSSTTACWHYIALRVPHIYSAIYSKLMCNHLLTAE